MGCTRLFGGYLEVILEMCQGGLKGKRHVGALVLLDSNCAAQINMQCVCVCVPPYGTTIYLFYLHLDPFDGLCGILKQLCKFFLVNLLARI